VPTLFDALTGLPARVIAGEQTSWSESFADYPNSTYSVDYIFASNTPVDGFQKYTVAGSESSTSTRTFPLPSGMKPGVYDYEVRITRTSDSVTRVASRGCLVVAPDLSVTPTETYAQAQVAAIKTALTTLSASTNVSVSFNGQSFQKGDTAQLRGQLAYWESRVLKERAALQRLTDATAEYRCTCDCE
jgi:hypothetical protein